MYPYPCVPVPTFESLSSSVCISVSVNQSVRQTDWQTNRQVVNQSVGQWQLVDSFESERHERRVGGKILAKENWMRWEAMWVQQWDTNGRLEAGQTEWEARKREKRCTDRQRRADKRRNGPCGPCADIYLSNCSWLESTSRLKCSSFGTSRTQLWTVAWKD